MKYYRRILEKELRQSAKEYPVIAVLGPRQSGKTTLVQKTFPRKPYISLENLENREFALQDPAGFLKTHNAGAVIDEVQRVPHLLSYIQTEVDSNKKKGRYILTGSNQLILEEKITQSLAGRVSLLRLLPFSLKELENYKQIKSIEEFIFKGFYPPLYSENIRIERWLNNYIDTYVHKDVRLIKNVSNLSQFSTFIKMCAARIGQIVNLQSLSSDCGISQNTAKSWLSILESSFIIKKLHCYYKNFNKRLVKSPKIFFYDTGLACQLLSIKKPSELLTHSLKGNLFENFIFAELEKHFFNLGEKPPIYFWRNKSGNEIDFIIDAKTIKVIEVKSGRTIASDFFKNIEYFSKISNIKMKSYLVYVGTKKQIRKHTVAFPWRSIHEVFK